jgi:SAM-dependent methyltransferase
MGLINRFYTISLHRQLLEKNILKFSSLGNGRLLDIGSKNRRYDSLFKNAISIVAVDIKPGQEKDIILSDAQDLPFRNNSFDTVVSFETLEYIPATERVFREIARVLKSNGLLIFSMPFLNPVHADMDSVRYTDKTLRQILKGNFEVKEFCAFGGRYCLIWDLFFEKIRNHSSNFWRYLLYPFLAVSQKIAIYLDNKEENWRFPMGYFFVCRKKS